MAYLEQPVRAIPISTPFTSVFDSSDTTRITVTEAFYPPTGSLHARMIFLLGFVLGVAFLFALIRPTPDTGGTAAEAAVAPAPVGEIAAAGSPASGLISPVFAAPVQHWAPQIVAWSAAFGVDPNMVATVMQIESCGDPQAVSSAGAQGLFQVMPFHFTAGEDMRDPNTNAQRGIAYLVERLEQTKGDVGRAFAGYNGGHVAAGGAWDSWAAETQRYFVWSTGIYGDVVAGNDHSDTMQRWLAAGGASLCRQAAERLGLPK